MIMKLNSQLKKGNNQKGFTLVELIVVMAVLAILAALAVPKFTGVLQNAKNTGHETNITMIERAVELYIAEETTKGNTVPDSDLTIEKLIEKKYLKANKDSTFKGPNGEEYEINRDENDVITVTKKE